ncbi:MAG: hypothetical protein P4L22_03780 [Candidatus Babeliales bacterium]|nr:hypothetical protein [Candidatus Babeliales bacterium]
MLKKTNVVLSFENREHLKAIFVLLMTVDKRLKAMPPVAKPKKKAKEAKPRKTKKTKKDNDTSSLIRELFLFLKFLFYPELISYRKQFFKFLAF